MITRNALISILVLLAGLCTGYFASRATGGSPLLSMDDTEFSHWLGTADRPDTSSLRFYGSSVELSHMYHHAKSDFNEVVGSGVVSLREARVQRDRLLFSRDTATSDLEEYNRLIAELEYKTELLRLLDYFTNYYMHYYRWIDTGHLPSAVSYKLAMGQFRATVSYHQEKYKETPNPRGMDLEELLVGTHVAGQSDRSVRWARVLTVILLFMLIMGIPRFIRDRDYRKFAATLYFDAIFRPNKVSDLNAWHSIARMGVALIVLYLFGGVVLSSFSSWLLPLVLGALGLLPVVFLALLINNNRKNIEIVVSLMAPKVLVMIVFLGVVAVRGPMFFWYHIWVSELFRTLFLAVLTMMVFHKFHVHMVLIRKWSHLNRSGAAALLGMAAGLQCLLGAIFLKVFGLEKSLQALNRDLVLLPGGSRDMLGIADWMGLSPEFPDRLIVISGIILIINTLIFLIKRVRPKPLSGYLKA